MSKGYSGRKSTQKESEKFPSDDDSNNGPDQDG